MKRLLFFAIAAFFAAGSIALAQPNTEYGPRRSDPRFYDGDDSRRVVLPVRRRMEREVRQLNRYRAHVRDKMRAYGASRAAWREFGGISSDIERINRRIRYTYYTPGELQGQIRFLRHRLRRLERSVGFRQNDFFIWAP